MGNAASAQPKKDDVATVPKAAPPTVKDSQPPRQPSSSNSKIRSSSAHKPISPSEEQDLNRSKTFLAKGSRESSEIKFKGYSQIRAPHLKEVNKVGRNEDYSIEYNQVRQSRLEGKLNDLQFKMDDPDGVSEQAHIYTFDYERSLNHFINWNKERADGRSSMIVSK